MANDPAIETTEEFRGEYELALEKWLRRRFAGLWGTLFAIELALTALWSFTLISRIDEQGFGAAASISPVRLVPPLSLLVLAWFHFRIMPRLQERNAIIKAATRMIICLGFLDLVATLLPDVATTGILGIYFLHLVSSLFLPWRPIESLRPMVPLMVAWLLMRILFIGSGNPVELLIAISVAPLGLIPGLGVCAFRMWTWNRRFRTAALARGFGVLRQEVKQARRIHESLFPSPIEHPDFTFDFVFRPMRDLGGDFIHASDTPTGGIRVVLVDVTGHGLTAAMTVTRLSGEIERVVAEDPNIGPAAILVALNRYANLVLSQHSIFATAIAAELDPADGTLRIANAGHPPAFLRRRDGSTDSIESSGIILGALESDEYECEETRRTLDRDDLLLLYTDGVIETRDRSGSQLGIDRVGEAMKRMPAPPSWTEHLASLADAHRFGPPEDDLLIATLAHHPTSDRPESASSANRSEPEE
ncbi:MAG: hypothetical protein CMJ51_01005 [Planctomycetaceae bacterium]|nr:hypothetical protein [Planctomycetaceae bacterium]